MKKIVLVVCGSCIAIACLVIGIELLAVPVGPPGVGTPSSCTWPHIDAETPHCRGPYPGRQPG
ncbi:hypothetical protein ACWEVD_19270 [Nocardia thailandica]|uniref:hypothetical protein n=1 Tax=Nocardia thailandica TaxID=257275 RepID=UPI0012F9AC68|nr:hypothetical protein [Nocardia thailandica]